jgi:hypothetical protein
LDAAKERRIEWPLAVPRSPDPDVSAQQAVVFDAIIATRATGDWSQMDLIQAGRAAVHMADILRDEQVLSQRGVLTKVQGKHGPQVVRSPLLDALSSRVSLMRDALRPLGLSQVAVDPRTLKNGALLQQSVNSSSHPLLAGGDDLLA